MSLLLAPLRECSIDRHNKAVQGLKDGSLTVTPTRQTEAEIRALVKNGDGHHYGVILTEHGAFCSCPDSLYRGVVCKHSVATCVFCLQHLHTTEDRIHLMWPTGEILCGLTEAKRFWRNWTYNALNWSDVCPSCVHAWTQPAVAVERR
jgi:hypothetical protein